MPRNNPSDAAFRAGKKAVGALSLFADARDETFNNGVKSMRDFSATQLNNEKIKDSQFKRQQLQKGINDSFNFAPESQVKSFRNFRKTGSFKANAFPSNELNQIKAKSPVFKHADPLFLPQPQNSTPQVSNVSNRTQAALQDPNRPIPLKAKYSPDAISLFGEDFLNTAPQLPEEVKLQKVIDARRIQPKFVNDSFVSNFDRMSNRENLARIGFAGGDLSGIGSVIRAENPQLPKGAQDALAFSFLGDVDPNKPEQAREALSRYLGVIGQGQQPTQDKGFRHVDNIFKEQTGQTQPVVNPNADTEGQTFSQDPLGYSKALAGQGVDVLLEKIDAVSDWFSNSGLTPDTDQQEAYNSMLQEAINQGVPLELRNGQVMVGNQFLDDYLKGQIQNVETQTGNPQEDIRGQFERLQQEGVIPNSNTGLESLAVGEQRPYTHKGQTGVVTKNGRGLLHFKVNGGNQWQLIETP